VGAIGLLETRCSVVIATHHQYVVRERPNVAPECGKAGVLGIGAASPTPGRQGTERTTHDRAR
jgi:hypothetical protein